MRIKVAEDRLVRALKELEGVDVLVKSADEARKVLELIIRHTEVARRGDFRGAVDFNITESLEYPTTSVEYKRYYEIEFLSKDDAGIDVEIELIRELQRMFRD
jgi:hypothetical protein